MAGTGARCRMAVGDFVSDIVGNTVTGVGDVVTGVGTDFGNMVTDLGGGIAGLSNTDLGNMVTDLGGGIAGIGQDVYNNTVGLASDPSNILSGINALANLTGRTNPVTGPLSMAYNFAAQGEKDKNLGINNPSLLGRGFRSLVPGFIQKPVFDFLGVTGDPDPFGGYGSPEAQEEGVAGIDTGSTGGDATYDVGGGGQPVDTSQVTTYGGSEFGFDPDPDQPGPDQAQVDANISRSRSLETMDWDESEEGQAAADAAADEESGFGESSDWNKGGAVGFDTGGMAVGRFGAYMGDEDDAAELAQVSAEQETIRRFDEMEKNRQLQQEIRQAQFLKRQQELEPGERLFSETASPETRTSSSRAVIPPGFLNRNIPVGIEILQNFSKQQLTSLPAEVMKRHNFKQQAIRKNKQDSLKITYKINNAPDFITNTLVDAKEVRASLKRSKQETIDHFARKFKNVQKTLGFGTTLTLSPENLNAVLNADYTTSPNHRNFSGNVGIPLSDDTTVNVGAQRNLVEGGENFNTYEVGVNKKLGEGILGLNVRKNPRENYFGINFNMPLNP